MSEILTHKEGGEKVDAVARSSHVEIAQWLLEIGRDQAFRDEDNIVLMLDEDDE